MENHLKETKAFFDKIAPTWDQYSINNPYGTAIIVALGNITPGLKIADVACGTGVLFKHILAKGPSELWGVDLSDKMLKIAAEKHSDDLIHLWAGDFQNFDQENFDRVFIYRAYPHFPDKSAFAKKLFSILTPGGRFIIGHCESRQSINLRHSKGAAHVSDILAPVSNERAYFDELFDIDIIADTEYLYVISGTRR